MTGLLPPHSVDPSLIREREREMRRRRRRKSKREVLKEIDLCPVSVDVRLPWRSFERKNVVARDCEASRSLHLQRNVRPPPHSYHHVLRSTLPHLKKNKRKKKKRKKATESAKCRCLLQKRERERDSELLPQHFKLFW